MSIVNSFLYQWTLKFSKLICAPIPIVFKLCLVWILLLQNYIYPLVSIIVPWIFSYCISFYHIRTFPMEFHFRLNTRFLSRMFHLLLQQNQELIQSVILKNQHLLNMSYYYSIKRLFKAFYHMFHRKPDSNQIQSL